MDADYLQLRHDYMSCVKLAKETDSKKEDTFLKEEAHKALSQLEKLCPHQHIVCTKTEYEGCSIMDYDDHNPEHRVCLCCGQKDSAYGNEFKILTNTPFARFEGKYPDQIKNPLSYLLTEATEVAEKEGYHYFGRVRMR
jgi:hypothetical protein